MPKPEVAVLYHDLNVVRVAWADKRTLKFTDVLAIAVLNDGKRNQSSILHDYYQLIWTDTDCCLTGHDGDYGFFSFDGGTPDWRFPFLMPTNYIEFEGVYQHDQKKWQEALLIYADPDGGMF